MAVRGALPVDAGIFSEKRVIRQYRNVFGTQDGRQVLSHYIRTLGHFNADPGNDYDRGKQDAAKILLRLCGVWEPENADDLVTAYFAIPTKPGSPGYGG